MGFFWRLLGQQTHCIRVRIAEATTNDSAVTLQGEVVEKDRYLENLIQSIGEKQTVVGRNGVESTAKPNDSEQKVLDRVGEALARLGRVKRVALTIEDKAVFVKAWTKK